MIVWSSWKLGRFFPLTLASGLKIQAGQKEGWDTEQYLGWGICLWKGRIWHKHMLLQFFQHLKHELTWQEAKRPGVPLTTFAWLLPKYRGGLCIQKSSSIEKAFSSDSLLLLHWVNWKCCQSEQCTKWEYSLQAQWWWSYWQGDDCVVPLSAE